MKTLIVGVDEVGRGCLAGPVFAGAVAFRGSESLELFKDSKSLTAKKREAASALIREHHWWALGYATVEEIDAINILQASFLAMRRAIEALVEKVKAEQGEARIEVLVDGHLPIPQLAWPQEPIVQGDQSVAEISAASIIAKVERDRLMIHLHEEFPFYDFQKNKGYPSASHREALKVQGPTAHHRRSFRGVC